MEVWKGIKQIRDLLNHEKKEQLLLWLTLVTYCILIY